ATTPVPLGLLEDFLPTLAGLRPALGTRHGSAPSRLTRARGEATRLSPDPGSPAHAGRWVAGLRRVTPAGATGKHRPSVSRTGRRERPPGAGREHDAPRLGRE